MNKEWISLHIFYHDFSRLDFLLNNLIYPLKSKYLQDSQYFFLRYWEGGPHIRLRATDDNLQVDAIIQHIEEFLSKYPDVSGLTKNDFYGQRMNLEREDIKKYKWYENNSIKVIPYHIENDNFTKSNAEMIHVLFHFSSEFCLDLLSQLHDKEKKIQAAIYFTLIFISYLMDFKHEQILDFSYNHSKSWASISDKDLIQNKAKRYIENNKVSFYKKINKWDEFLSNNAFFEQIVFNCKKLQYENNFSDDTNYFLGGYIHTTMNRIGLTPIEEAFALAIVHEAVDKKLFLAK